MRDLTLIELEAVAGGAAREPIKGRITPPRYIDRHPSAHLRTKTEDDRVGLCEKPRPNKSIGASLARQEASDVPQGLFAEAGFCG